MFKTLITILLVVAVFTSLSIFIPDGFSSSIDGAIVYFLNALYNLNALLDASVLIACLQTLINFYIGVSIFWVFRWTLKLTQ